MDENDPVACLPFLNPEASDRGRVVIVKNQNHRKNQNRLSPRSLLVACVKLVDDYNCEALPDIAPEDHATILMPRLNASHPHDQTFLTQVTSKTILFSFSDILGHFFSILYDK